MTTPAAQLLFDQRIVAAKKYELYFVAYPQTIAVSTFQCRTGQHGIFSSGEQLLDLFAQAVQPRPSVLVGERLTAAHLLNICRRMKIVGFKKLPAEVSRQ